MWNWIRRLKKREYLTPTRIAGHTFWSYNNALEIPTKRQLFFQTALREAELGVTTEDLRAIIQLVATELNAGDVYRASQYIGMLEMYLDLYTNHEVMFKISDSIILIDDEPEDPNSLYTAKKREMFDKSDEVKGFFLLVAQSILKDIGRLSQDTPIEDYLKGKIVQQTELRLRQLIDKGLSKSI
jgi:hypothetical protein